MAVNPPAQAGPTQESGNRVVIFWLELGFLLVLAVLAWAYYTPTAPAWLRAPATYGVIPSGVLWFGALGGVLISLAGVHEHRYDWDSRYWTWHLIRPVVGAAFGVVAVIIVMAGILAIGSDPTPPPAPGAAGADAGATPTTDTKDMFYFLIAFVVGYREMHFRELMKRLGDVFFTSKDESPPATVVDVAPASGAAAGGTLVRITGSGFVGVSAVLFGPVDAAAFTVVSDAQIDATAPPGAVGPVSVSVVTSKGAATGGRFTYL